MRPGLSLWRRGAGAAVAAPTRIHTRLAVRNRAASTASTTSPNDGGAASPLPLLLDPADVTVLGGGPVGLAMACALGQEPLLGAHSIVVLDAAPAPARRPAADVFSNRVSCLTPGSVRLLQALKIWDAIEDYRARPFRRMQVWDAVGAGHISLDAADLGSTAMGTLVENDLIMHLLEERLADMANVRIVRGAQVEDLKYARHSAEGAEGGSVAGEDSDVVHLQLADGKSLATRLLVGADGPNSIVRRCMELPGIGWQYDQAGVVATISIEETAAAADDERANNTAWQRFLPSGPLALLPLNDNTSSLVWSTSRAQAKELVALPAEDFVEALNRALHAPSSAFGPSDTINLAALHESPSLFTALEFVGKAARRTLGVAGDMTAGLVNAVSGTDGMFREPPRVVFVVADSRAAFPLSFAHATNYVCPRVALAGDAAHKVHPLAGQGLNLGFGDVAELSSLLAEAAETGQDVGELRNLLLYERRRQTAAVPILAACDTFKRLFSNANPVLSSARNAGLSLTNALGPLKNEITKLAMR